MGARHTDRGLFRQYEEAEARAEKWETTAKEERTAHKKEISDMMANRKDIEQKRSGRTDCVRESGT